MQIFTFGPKFSNSYKLAERYFPTANKIPCENLQEICQKLSTDKTFFAMLPLQCPTNGIFQNNIEHIIQHKLQIWDTLTASPKLSIAAKSRSLTTVCSTSENLALSKTTLQKNFPKLKQFITPDLKTAIEHSLYNPEVACIIPDDLIKVLQLEKIGDSLIDPTQNQITYGLLNLTANPKVKERSYIGIQLDESKSTNHLLNILHPFKEHNVEIFKVHSLKPLENKTQQLFCFEIQGDFRQARFRQIQVFLERDLKICKVHELGGVSHSLEPQA